MRYKALCWAVTVPAQTVSTLASANLPSPFPNTTPNRTGPSGVSAPLWNSPFSEFSNSLPLAQRLTEVALHALVSIQVLNAWRIARAPEQSYGRYR